MKHNLKFYFAYCALCAILFTSFAYAKGLEEIEQQIREEKSKLIKIKREIKQNNKEIAKRKKKERSLLTEIEQANDALEVMNKELKIYEWNLNKNNLKKKDITAQIEKIEKVLHKKKITLKKRLRIIYKEGSRAYIKAILSAENFFDVMQKMKYMNTIARYDWQIIEDFKEETYRLKNIEKNLKNIEEEIFTYRQGALEKKQEIEGQRGKKRSFLKRIQTKRGLLKRVAVELGENQEGLKGLIERLRSRKKILLHTLPDFAKKKGEILWPVKGKIISPFGKVKNERIGAFLFNNGVDIAAPLGTEILSVYGGEVIYAGWMNGYGRLIIIDHGGNYYSLYAHLEELMVAVGDKIKEEQAIAKVGREGTFTDTPSLYFEIRHRGNPQDPIDWFK